MRPQLALLISVFALAASCAQHFDFVVAPEDAGTDADAELLDTDAADSALDDTDAATDATDVPRDVDADIDVDDADTDVPDTDVGPACTSGTFSCEDDRYLYTCEAEEWAIVGDCRSAVLCPAGALSCACDAEGGTCRAQLCVPGERRCDGQDVVVCEADAETESLVLTCDPSEICVDGGCDVATCETPGEQACRGDMLMTCGDDGVWAITSCQDAGAFCDGELATCVPWFCEPGVDTQCISERAEIRCDERGAAYGAPEECGDGATCLEDGCQPFVCLEGATRCGEAGLERCAEDRLSWVVEDACDPYGCASTPAPHCRACEPGATRCSDDQRQAETCSEAGEWSSRGCEGDELCLSGVCMTVDCTPGVVDCLGEVARSCGDDGVWRTVDCVTEASFCDGGACEPWRCTPGATRCDSGDLQTCADRGDGWDAPVSCGDDATCVGDVCVPLVCTPDALSCVDGDTSTYRICDSTGTAWLTWPCADDTACVEGECLPVICEPGTQQCGIPPGGWGATEDIGTCNATGTEITYALCGDEVLCWEDVCQPIICPPMETMCDEADPQQVLMCGWFGLQWRPDEVCGSGEICEDGGCVDQICVPDRVRCVGADGEVEVERCNPLGTAWELGVCADGEVCVDDACVPTICTPGELACDALGENVDVCDPLGVAWDHADHCWGAEVCEFGVCADPICEPGEMHCVDSATLSARYELCSEGGTRWLSTVCVDDELCVSDACVAPVCVVGETRCATDQFLEVCNGFGWDTTVCGDEEVCDDEAGRCVIRTCGDGVVDTGNGETCDDGNTDPCDGCDYCERSGTLVLTTDTRSVVPARVVIDYVPFTVEFWVRTTSLDGQLLGMDDGGVGPAEDQFSFEVREGHLWLVLSLYQGPDALMEFDLGGIADGVWHHVAAGRVNDGVVAAHVDGRSVVAAALPAVYRSLGVTEFWFGGGARFPGPSIDAEVDDVALTVGQYRYSANSSVPSAPVVDGATRLYFDFDGLWEGTAQDVAGGQRISLVAADSRERECASQVCGDGHVDVGEQCDDGNLRSGDGCDRTCAVEYLCSAGSASAGNGMCFVLGGVGDWFDAEDLCLAVGGSPAGLQTPADVLTALTLDATQEVGTGGRGMAGTFTWTADGTPISLENPMWMTGEPESSGWVVYESGGRDEGQWQTTSPLNNSEVLCQVPAVLLGE